MLQARTRVFVQCNEMKWLLLCAALGPLRQCRALKKQRTSGRRICWRDTLTPCKRTDIGLEREGKSTSSRCMRTAAT